MEKERGSQSKAGTLGDASKMPPTSRTILLEKCQTKKRRTLEGKERREGPNRAGKRVGVKGDDNTQQSVHRATALTGKKRTCRKTAQNRQEPQKSLGARSCRTLA